MISKYAIVPATDEHILTVAKGIRLEDRREIWASNKATPHRSLLRSKRMSDEMWAGTVDGEAVCLFGIVPLSLLSPVGIVWMLGTSGIERHDRAFLRRNRGWIAEALTRYELLVNMVDARNTKAIKWLKWLGAEFENPVPWGEEELPFMPFKIERKHV